MSEIPAEIAHIEARLLDAYFLHLIGLLDPESARQAESHTGRLQLAFDADRGTWDQLIERRLALTTLDVTTIRRAYEEQLALDDELGQPHDPHAWARGMTDAFRGAPPQDEPTDDQGSA
ncbi:hypothetical protein [Agrococcus jejuensis]|uniref:Uncharacterized protein n=1 Tax=Agrococcus jejuensis TaxID=399736 RepID=A0A1G8D727_9MICO|nr:hypothetical protein [Agrococcus jejuensis]SDH53565.1 hypothetical protein SAMN04489720_1541 [Agrococcus jejuensis]